MREAAHGAGKAQRSMDWMGATWTAQTEQGSGKKLQAVVLAYLESIKHAQNINISIILTMNWAFTISRQMSQYIDFREIDRFLDVAQS